MKCLGTTLFVALFVMTVEAGAEVVEVRSFDGGWYRDDGVYSSINNNVFSGTSYIQPRLYDYNTYLIFDLSRYENVTSATLQLDVSARSAPGTFNFYDVSTSIPSLRAGTGGVTTFNDLGSGIYYGSVSNFPSFSTIQITLNADAISSINDSEGLWVIGGSYQSSGYVVARDGINKIILEASPVTNTVIKSFTVLPNDMVQLTWTNYVDQKIWIEQSTHLTDWIPLAGPLTNEFSWSGAIDQSSSHFFRIRSEY